MSFFRIFPATPGVLEDPDYTGEDLNPVVPPHGDDPKAIAKTPDDLDLSDYNFNFVYSCYKLNPNFPNAIPVLKVKDDRGATYELRFKTNPDGTETLDYDDMLKKARGGSLRVESWANQGLESQEVLTQNNEAAMPYIVKDGEFCLSETKHICLCFEGGQYLSRLTNTLANTMTRRLEIIVGIGGGSTPVVGIFDPAGNNQVTVSTPNAQQVKAVAEVGGVKANGKVPFLDASAKWNGGKEIHVAGVSVEQREGVDGKRGFFYADAEPRQGGRVTGAKFIGNGYATIALGANYKSLNSGGKFLSGGYINSLIIHNLPDNRLNGSEVANAIGGRNAVAIKPELWETESRHTWSEPYLVNTVDTIAARDGSSSIDGDYVFVKADNQIYQKQGVNWTRIGGETLKKYNVTFNGVITRVPLGNISGSSTVKTFSSVEISRLTDGDSATYLTSGAGYGQISISLQERQMPRWFYLEYRYSTFKDGAYFVGKANGKSVGSVVSVPQSATKTRFSQIIPLTSSIDTITFYWDTPNYLEVYEVGVFYENPKGTATVEVYATEDFAYRTDGSLVDTKDPHYYQRPYDRRTSAYVEADPSKFYIRNSASTGNNDIFVEVGEPDQKIRVVTSIAERNSIEKDPDTMVFCLDTGKIFKYEGMKDDFVYEFDGTNDPKLTKAGIVFPAVPRGLGFEVGFNFKFKGTPKKDGLLGASQRIPGDPSDGATEILLTG